MIPAPVMVRAPVALLSDETKFVLPVVIQVGHEIAPVVVSSAIGSVAATAIVPDAFGTVNVLVVELATLLKLKLAVLELRVSIIDVVPLSSDLFVNV